MLLGKRPRPPIRRTTSMTGITVDVSNVESQEPSDPQNPINDLYTTSAGTEDQNMSGVGLNGFDYRVLATVSPRNYRRNSSDHSLETAHFLRTCGLCNRRLSPGRDIYMYRGDTAFCSLECREQQMKQDERKEKCSMASSMKEERHAAAAAPPPPPTATSKPSTKSETVAAA